jgi:hypothetical protein
MRVSDIAVDALIKPMEITIKDPAVLFVQIYTFCGDGRRGGGGLLRCWFLGGT